MSLHEVAGVRQREGGSLPLSLPPLCTCVGVGLCGQDCRRTSTKEPQELRLHSPTK